jgi:MinD-like ATPase involved in chromosome partitioning or flagellar assembly
MLTVTFYSFRGGVGRTMALANVAAHLARSGQQVFLIDFDLEAPGLSLMPEFRPQTPPESDEGLVGYLRAGLEDRPLPSLPSLCYEPVLAHQLREGQSNVGAIHVLPADARAGTERQYDLAKLHLERLYETQSRALVIDALKVQIQEHYRPDYVLVDSRTGLTDVGGICTVHLADLLVIVSGLNEQNIEGTRLAVERLRAARTDFAEKVLFVISPVPLGEEELKAKRLGVAAERFAQAMQTSRNLTDELLTVPYHPQIALSEGSFVFHHPQSPVAAAFRRIAEAIRDRNPADTDKQFRRLTREIERGDQLAVPNLFQLAESNSAPRDARMMAAMFNLGAQEYEAAIRYFRILLDEDPSDHETLDKWATALSAQAKTKTGAEADELFAQASEKYAAALRIKPDLHEALNNWGNALSDQAKTKTGAEADELFAQAYEKYAAALRIKPYHYEAFYNWGNALSEQAATRSGPEAKRLLAKAGEKYAAAVQIKPDMLQAFVDWGNALADQAEMETGMEQARLFALAGEKYTASSRICTRR